MPFGDGTGPLGQGPMTGRGAGFCRGYNRPGYANPILRRKVGFAQGWFGRGRGWRNWYRATGLPGWQRAKMGYPAWGGWGYYFSVQPTVKEEREILTEELKTLQEEMKALEDRLEELKKKK